MPSAALTIAGSDPSGGAGIQADLKTFHQFGVYGEAVLTLVTVQNTRSVSRVEMLPAAVVVEQIEAVIGDIAPQAAKTGALGNAEIVEAVAELAKSFDFPLVVDPVLISKHGARLMSREAEHVLKHKLLPLATLVTPNVHEAEALTGLEIQDARDMELCAERILELGCKAVLIKGGHLQGEPLDLFASGGEIRKLSGKRVATRHTHGTGCAYSAAITALLANGELVAEAVQQAKIWIQDAIEQAPGFGSGYGPVNHFAELRQPVSISERLDRLYRSRR